MNHELRAFDREELSAGSSRAVRPDILCLQEINYFRKDRELADFVERLLGAPEGEVLGSRARGHHAIATRFEVEGGQGRRGLATGAS